MKPTLSIPLLTAGAIVLSSCQTNTGTGALGGAAVGAVAGAIVGGDDSDIATGAILGGAVGAAAGAVSDHQQAAQYPVQETYPQTPQAPYGQVGSPQVYQPNPGAYGNAGSYQTPQAPAPTPNYGQPQAPAPPVQPAQPQYPFGAFTNRPGEIRSPHAPNNVIDITGFKSGDLVVDPTTEKVLRIP